MIDLPVRTADHGRRFHFRVGNNNTPSSWSTAPRRFSSGRRRSGGSDRVSIIWANSAIANTWLQVITLANANTGLSQKPDYPAGEADVFFFGNDVGNSGLGDTAINARSTSSMKWVLEQSTWQQHRSRTCTINRSSGECVTSLCLSNEPDTAVSIQPRQRLGAPSDDSWAPAGKTPAASALTGRRNKMQAFECGRPCGGNLAAGDTALLD
jgi:hypothetical protein